MCHRRFSNWSKKWHNVLLASQWEAWEKNRIPLQSHPHHSAREILCVLWYNTSLSVYVFYMIQQPIENRTREVSWNSRRGDIRFPRTPIRRSLFVAWKSLRLPDFDHFSLCSAADYTAATAFPGGRLAAAVWTDPSKKRTKITSFSSVLFSCQR